MKSDKRPTGKVTNNGVSRTRSLAGGALQHKALRRRREEFWSRASQVERARRRANRSTTQGRGVTKPFFPISGSSATQKLRAPRSSIGHQEHDWVEAAEGESRNLPNRYFGDQPRGMASLRRRGVNTPPRTDMARGSKSDASDIENRRPLRGPRLCFDDAQAEQERAQQRLVVDADARAALHHSERVRQKRKDPAEHIFPKLILGGWDALAPR